MKKLPGIGLRIIKSAIAVGLCFVVDSLRDGAGIVFYSQLSALWCMQVYRKNTKKNAWQRTIGTLIGAGYGLLFLLTNNYLQDRIPFFEFESRLAISLLIILVLYTTVVIKKKQASYFSCVVFLSIVVNHVGDADPYIFVINRFLDTMIGIVIGILVNDFELPTKKDKDTLYISTMDDTLLSNSKMSDFSRVELNRLIDEGLNFTIATMRTPAIISENMREVNLKYPVIAMDGAVMFDIKTKTYLKSYVISKTKAKEIRDFIEKYTAYYFTNIVIDDTLLIYYQEEMSGIMRSVVDDLRENPYRNYLKRPVPEDEEVLYYMILEETQKQERLYQALEEAGYTRDFKVDFYPSTEHLGYSYIKIFNKNATMENMENYLLEYAGLNKKMTLGTIKDKYDILISGENVNEAVKTIKATFEQPLWLTNNRK